jgi:hypothetical protein
MRFMQKPRQMMLIEPRTDWRLDERTKEIGRHGIDQARRALVEAARRAAAVATAALDAAA